MAFKNTKKKLVIYGTPMGSTLFFPCFRRKAPKQKQHLLNCITLYHHLTKLIPRVNRIKTSQCFFLATEEIIFTRNATEAINLVAKTWAAANVSCLGIEEGGRWVLVGFWWVLVSFLFFLEGWGGGRKSFFVAQSIFASAFRRMTYS